jgi:nucleoside transporter
VHFNGRRFERAELATLFFLNAAAAGMWLVPFGNVLNAHGYGAIVPFGYACSGVAAFISPMIFGALADQHIPPARLLRWLSLGCAAFIALTFFAIENGWRSLAVLGALQCYAIFAAPSFGLATTIIMARLREPERQFGPIRAWATFGWMASGFVVSWVLLADTSTLSGFAAAATWLLAALWTFALPHVPPADFKAARNWRDVFGLEALELFKDRNHRVVFITGALFNIPMAAFYPYAPMHLREAGVEHASAAMTLGQVSEILAMIGLAWLLARCGLKWVFLAGIGFGALRYAFFALGGKAWLLAGVSLHGLAFTFYFITAQIYLERRAPARLRARAQALLAVMAGGFGNLAGYLGSGAWKSVNTVGPVTRWPAFWGVLSLVMAVVFVGFALTYRSREETPIA